MDKHGEGPYLEVKMPEGFLLQFRLDHGRWMDVPSAAASDA
jgi:hypothetical protein